LLAPLAAVSLWYAHAAAAVVPPASVDVAAADTAFGFRLLNAVQDSLPAQNVVLSPLSAALDLSVVLNGAEGQSREEMLAALSLAGSDLEALNTANAALLKTLATPTRSVTLSVAESLWFDGRRAMLRPEYVAQTRAWCDATITDLDFSSPGAAGKINAWAAQATDGRIDHVIERVDRDEFALLLNAVYFKGQWRRPFDKSKTQPRDFTLLGGTVAQVPRMSQSGHFDYFETPSLQAVRLSFGDGDLVMAVLLPAPGSSLRKLEAQLTQAQWADWNARYASRPGTLELPRFELRSRYRLNQALQTLGMTRIFKQQSAQLTGMFAAPPGVAKPGGFFISAVLQSTYWKVDEAGAEAAAVTAIGVTTSAMRRPPAPFSMIIDRPFFCAIEDRRSGALLFIGAIYDPTT